MHSPLRRREKLLAAEDALVDTVALAPPGGLVTDPYEPSGSDGGPGGRRGESSVARGIVQAGPLAVGGVLANAINVVATVLIARLLTTRQYGAVAQLLGVFFVLSMPGSAMLVGVVRRIAVRASAGLEAEAHRWSGLVYRRSALGLAGWCLLAVAVEEPLSHALNVPADGAVALTLIAGGVWFLLCIDRAILQVHRRYAPLGLNLFVEIAVRTVLVLAFAAAGFGVVGYAVGLLLGEVVAAGHARLLSRRAWHYPADAQTEREAAAGSHNLSHDLMTALVGFGLIGLLQNTDIIFVGRLDPASAGPYAAISVASKSLVFGAILLGSYVLPETTIRWQRGEHALRQLAVTLLFLGLPTVVLLTVAVAAPRRFLTIFFSARLSGGAPGFALLVGAMACLGLTVVLTNYLFGAARRWVVLFLAAGVVVLFVMVHAAHGAIVATARAELEVQGGLAAVVAVAFAVAHLPFRHPRRVPKHARRGVGAPR